MFIHALENGNHLAKRQYVLIFTLNPVAHNLFKGLGEFNKDLTNPGN